MKKVVAGVAMLLLLAACGGGGGGGTTTPKSIPLSKLPNDVVLRGEFILGDLGIHPNLDADQFAAAGVPGTKGATGATGGTGSKGSTGSTGPSTTTTTVAPIGAESIRGNLADCAGAGAFSDLVTGAPVVVSDTKGKAVGLGKIFYGVATNTYQGHINQCTFRWIVARLPHLNGYWIKIANQKPYPVSALAITLAHGAVRLTAKR